jgi:hypothetical protein
MIVILQRQNYNLLCTVEELRLLVKGSLDVISCKNSYPIFPFYVLH